MALGLCSSTRHPPGITGCCSARLAGSRAPRGSRAPPARAGCLVLPLTQRRNLPAGGGEWRVVLELVCVSPEDPLPHSHRALLPSRPWRPPPAPVLALSRPYFAPTAFRPACRCRAPSAASHATCRTSGVDWLFRGVGAFRLRRSSPGKNWAEPHPQGGLAGRGVLKIWTYCWA
jgi:hypothetical protein